ncbi:hypothetical protein Tco_0067412 [Tanacetum coccineum]
MTSYNRRGCFKCVGPFGGLYCRQCTCERCRRNYTDEVCALCCYEVEKSFVNDSNLNSFIDSLNIFHPPPQPQTYSCEFCENDAHYGYDFPPQVPLFYEPEPCYNHDFDNDFPQNFQNYPQQYLCFLTNSNPRSFPSFINQDLKQQYLDEMKKKASATRACGQSLDLSFATFQFFCYDDDDDDDDEEYTIAITPFLPTEEPDNSLSMGDEHLSTIPETESDELIKSSVKNLVPFPSDSDDFSDIKSECDVPVCDIFTTFSNPLFDADDDFSSRDDESFSDEDILKEIYSNPLFDEEIISTKNQTGTIKGLHQTEELIKKTQIISSGLSSSDSSTQVVTTSDFSNYIKANDAVMKNMQTQMTSLTNSNIELKNMFGQFMKMNTASTSGSGSLPSNTVANPRGDLKAITTR